MSFMEGFDKGRKEQEKCELSQETHKKGYQTRGLKGKQREHGESQEKKELNESPCFSLLVGEERPGYPSEKT